MKKYWLKVFYITSLIFGVILSLCIVSIFVYLIYLLVLEIPNIRFSLDGFLLFIIILVVISIVVSGPKILFWSLDKLKNMK